MNKIFNFFGRVALTILTILLIGYGWAFFEIKILLKSNPELFGFIFYQQTDSTMISTFSEDDVVVIKKDANYQIGDKIMYMTEDNDYYIRNVTNVSDERVNLSCDNCKLENEEVSKNAVIGKAVGKINSFGKFIKFFKQKWFLITLAVIGFSFVIISQYIHETPKKIS